MGNRQPGSEAIPTPRGALTVMARVADRFGVSEGQLYTLVLALTIGLATAITGIPPTLREPSRSAAAGSPAAAPNSPEPAVAEADHPVTSPEPSATSPSPAPRLTLPPTPDDDRPAPTDPSPASPSTPPSDRPSVEPFAEGGTFGHVEPLTDVAPPGAPHGIVVDPATGEFFVATDNVPGLRGGDGPSRILRYDPHGKLIASSVVDGQPRTRSWGLTGLARDDAGAVYALDPSTGRILVFDPRSGELATWIRLPDVAPCTPIETSECEVSLLDRPPEPMAAAVTGSGDLLVADAGQGLIWRVSRAGKPEIWDRALEYLDVSGGLAGIALDPAGDVVVTLRHTDGVLGGSIVVVEVDDDGNAIGRQELWRAGPGQSPAGVAVGDDGRIYVADAASHRLVVLSADGEIEAVIVSEHLAQPTGLAIRGGSLLVTNRASTGGDEPRWSVVRVSVDAQDPS